MLNRAICHLSQMVESVTAQVVPLRLFAEPKSDILDVIPGNSLSKIAREVYGDASRWTEIFEANKDEIKDPNLIRPGQELRIP